MKTQMQCHLATSMLQQLQDNNKDSDNEHQKTEQEDPQKTPPNKEWVEQSAAPMITKQVKLRKMFLQNYSLISIKERLFRNK